MIGLIKADFRKMSKSRSLIICMIIAAALGIGMALLYNYFWQEKGTSIAFTYNLMELYGIDTAMLDDAFSTIPKQNLWAFVNSFFSDEIKWILSAICISSFMASEYSMGTFKNTVSRGFSKEKIYFSKMVVCAAEAFLVTAAYVGAGAVTSLFFVETETDASLQEIALTMITYILLLIAMAALFEMLGVLFRSTGIAVAVAIAGPLLIVSIFNLLMSADPSVSAYLRYFLMQTFITVNDSVKDGEGFAALLTALAYFAVSTVTGCVVFKKSEIK
ncbi:MAG: ABC transporter permease subunit [Clostridia bacterium]|nr:ABC transporter permease subunit [Clostridia bacterium]